MKINITKILPLIFVLVISLSPQTEQDTLTIVQSTDSLNVSEDSVFVMQKSPTGAILRSAVIPGWGQIYNESYWKAPIVWGALGWFVYGWIESNNDYKFYRDKYLVSGLDSDLNVREFYKDQRDLFAVYIGLTYFLNIIDAYVDAHLFDFDVVMDKNISQKQLNFKIYF